MTSATSGTEPLYSGLGGDPDLGEIVEMFVGEMPERVETLLKQLDASDWEALRRTAHQIKGAAGSYGFDPISPRAGQLERAITEDQPEEQIRRAVAELADICKRVRAGTPA